MYLLSYIFISFLYYLDQGWNTKASKYRKIKNKVILKEKKTIGIIQLFVGYFPVSIFLFPQMSQSCILGGTNPMTRFKDGP